MIFFLKNVLTYSPSQSAPTVLVFKTWVGLWTWKKIRSNIWTRVIVIQKEKRPGCLFSFWIAVTLIFCTLLFSGPERPEIKHLDEALGCNFNSRFLGKSIFKNIKSANMLHCELFMHKFSACNMQAFYISLLHSIFRPRNKQFNELLCNSHCNPTKVLIY